MTDPRTPATDGLCDHPTSARVYDTGGWSCSRCEQFIDPPPDEQRASAIYADPQTPAIEAVWNSLEADLRVATGSDKVARDLIAWHRPAIEAEARAEAKADFEALGHSNVSYLLGRADALREAAEAVRKKLPNGYHRDAVLAILDPQS